MKKNAIKVLSAFLAVVLIFAGMSGLLRYRYADSITSIRQFYRQPEQSIDVLGLGTSHMYEGLCPAVLYREYGISAYDLCAPAQPVWNTYYYFEEALKTQTPKAVVFDVYMLNTNGDYDTAANAIKTTFGMKWSKTRLEAVKASFPEEDWKEQCIGFYQYHSRYSQLSAADLLPDNGDSAYYGDSYKGYTCYDAVQPLETPDILSCDKTRKLNGKHEEYYRKIIELAIANQIPLYVVSIPYDIADDTQKTVNTAAAIAAEYASPWVHFIDFNKLYDSMELDYQTDFSGKQHLNLNGSVKFTSYFGKILAQELSLPDHRGEQAYSTWQDNADTFYRIYENSKIKTIGKLPDYLDAVDGLDDSYYVLLVINTQISRESIAYDRAVEKGEIPENPYDISDEEYEDLLAYRQVCKETAVPPEKLRLCFGIFDEYPQGSVWQKKDGVFELVGVNDSGFETYKSFSRKNALALQAVEITGKDDTYTRCNLGYNGETLSSANGMTLFVYDLTIDRLVDCVSFPQRSNDAVRAD